jgi:hypothetical protein
MLEVLIVDSAEIIAGWKRRLVALANKPAHVFRDTPQDLIEQHYQRATNFVGYSEAEVADAESRLGVRFPAVFREYLREMGRSRGDLFRGSDFADISQFEKYRSNALELLSEMDPSLTLPPEAVVFMSHQGYTFVYVLGVGGFDSPPMQWIEMRREPHKIAGGFAGMVNAELCQMEENNAALLQSGGYYLSLRSDGISRQSYPAKNSGQRPLDREPEASRNSRSGQVEPLRNPDTSIVRCPRCRCWILSTSTRCSGCGDTFQVESRDSYGPSIRGSVGVYGRILLALIFVALLYAFAMILARVP